MTVLLPMKNRMPARYQILAEIKCDFLSNLTFSVGTLVSETLTKFLQEQPLEMVDIDGEQ